MTETKTILITGASSGFGKLTVPLLLAKGHTVVASIRGGQARFEQVFQKEHAQYPNQLLAIDLDLEKSEQIQNAIRFLEQRLTGRLDVLINNAGYGLMGVLEDQSEEQIRKQIEVNFFGTALLTRAALPFLRRSRGRILNISSVAGLFGFPFYGMYCASKFALEGLSEALYYDLKAVGVQVGLIEPGGFKTDFNSARQFGVQTESLSSPYSDYNQKFIQALNQHQMRADDPIKVARLISKLCDVKHVPLRNRIGKDALAVSALERLLPESLRLKLIDQVFSFAMHRSQKKTN